MSALRDILAPVDEGPAQQAEAAATLPTQDTADTGNEEADDGLHTSTTTTTRRNASGSVSSVYIGNKMKHLKKEDGIPLWRKDIQYDFLKLVFYDQTKCFTKHGESRAERSASQPMHEQQEHGGGWTFADIYIDAMAKSSKCSKILKEKLLQDPESAIGMAMVCLLVNLGRMNTTLNFFPEMRAQLRTYHSIPALQANQDPNAYKQLQDAPRLKSILKGATEDERQPSTLEEVRAMKVPRTNAVNLIFVMSQYAPKISEHHFTPPRDFFDIVMRASLTSASRARAFLWLIWWYLESDFSYRDSQRNPFGPGQYGDGEDSSNALPLKVPPLEYLTEDQAALENVDTESEMHFGEVKRKERIAILASEPSQAMTALKRARKEKGLTSARDRVRGGADFSDDEGSDAGWYRGATVSTSAGRPSGLPHDTDSQYTRSPSPLAARVSEFQAVNAAPKAVPAVGGDMRINNLLNDDAPVEVLSTAAASGPARRGPGRGNWRRNRSRQETVPLAVRGMEIAYQPLAPNVLGTPLSFVNEVPQHILPSTPGAYGGQLGNGLPHLSPQGHNVLNFVSQHPNARDPHIPTPSYQAQKRNRGVTQHQSAIMSHRRAQIDYTLDRKIRHIHQRAKHLREQEGSILRAWKRLRLIPSDYDSEEEEIKMRKLRERSEKDGGEVDWRIQVHGGKGKERADKENHADSILEYMETIRRPRVLIAGLASSMNGEVLDIGEEARSIAKTMRRASRRLERWAEILPGDSMIRRRQRALRAMNPSPGLSRSRRDRGYERQRYDEMEFDFAAGPSVQRQRSGTGRQSVRAGMGIQDERLKASFVPVEDDGVGELDEEERELLGEVDADESEEEERDEDDEEEDDDDEEMAEE